VDALHDVSLGADAGCTGFLSGIRELGWNWTHCCIAHDLGGSDGMLVDCIAAAAPGLPLVIILAGVTVMALFRPLYNFCQRRGWVK
jgi:hypothetical protein